MDTTSVLILVAMAAAVGVAIWHDMGGDLFGEKKAKRLEVQRIKEQSDKMLEQIEKTIAKREAKRIHS